MGGQIQARQEEEAKKEQAIVDALKERTKKLEESRDKQGTKRKPAQDLLKYFHYDSLKEFIIRDINEYKPRSYNLGKQVLDLVNHLFVKYYVPGFMYKCLIKTDPYTMPPVRGQPGAYARRRFDFMDDVFREWFIIMAQGGSFQKAVKGIMTKREAVIFLGLKNDFEVYENIWLAKMLALDIPPPFALKLIDRIFSSHFIDDPDNRLHDLLHFFANNYKEIGEADFIELTDFIASKVREKDFTFKGRTLGSIVRLSNEWHAELQLANLKHHGKVITSWDGFGLSPYQIATEQHFYDILELRTNRDLISEGAKQRHCVASYSYACVEGRCSIFSLRYYRKKKANIGTYIRGDEIGRVTMEVQKSTRLIIQIRGFANRRATDDEKVIIRRWSGEMGFIL